MISLGQLKIKLNFALGTSETNLLTNEKRVDAINTAVQNILEEYPVPQYVKSINLSFIGGIAELPIDCLMPLKLNDPTNAYVVYDRVDWDKFSLNISETYTIKWHEVDEEEKIYIYPTSPTSLEFWYIKNPEELVADDDEVRFNRWWTKAISEKAAERLFTDSSSFNRAEAKKIVANNETSKAWQIERSRITGIQDNRLTSIFTKRSLLNFKSSITTN